MLNRTAQIGLKIEAVEGTEEVLAAADFSGNRKDTAHRHKVNRYQRGLERPTLTKDAQLHSMHGGGLSFLEELVGGSLAANAPFHTTLRGLGFGMTTLKTCTFNVTAGAFYVGLLIGNNASRAAATKVARVIALPTGKLVLFPITGTFVNTDTAFGYNTAGIQPQGTIASVLTDAGWGFKPLSETDAATPPSLTTERRLGGQRHSYVGARGTGGLSMRMGEPLLLRAEFQGIPVYQDATTRTPRLGGFLSGVPKITNVPRVGRGIPFIFRTGPAATYTPILTEFEIQFNNQVAERSTITNVDLQQSGYLAPRIADRTPGGRVDPEHVLPAAGFDFIGTLQTGGVFEMLVQVGLGSEPNGQVVVYAPGVQLDGDYEPGDRNGITTSPLPLVFTSTEEDDELIIAQHFIA
jgi:hypothetical protein